MNTERFNRQVIDILAKRAANTCSNPDCAALTSGPAEEDKRAINVGEAAHIYGARFGSARFNSQMSDTERGDITNAIWLCCNCHKMADSDPLKFPAELLFEWRRLHEKNIIERLGKVGASLQYNLTQKRLLEFEKASYLAQQIIIDKPLAWEYKLTAELLRSLLGPIKTRWAALEKGLYAHPNKIIAEDIYLVWQQSKLDSLSRQIQAITQIVNGEIQQAWGAPGEPGSESQIYHVCLLTTEVCQKFLQWEESVRFITAPEVYCGMHNLLIGIAGMQLKKVFEIPTWLTNIFSTENPRGTYELQLIFEIPPEWEKDYNNAIKNAKRKLKKRW